MSVQIKITGSKIGGSAKLLNNVTVTGHEDPDVTVENTDILDNAEVLNGLNIEDVVERLKSEIENVDHQSREYKELQQILNTSRGNKEETVKWIARHIGRFSEGVLVNIVSEFLMRGGQKI